MAFVWDVPEGLAAEFAQAGMRCACAVGAPMLLRVVASDGSARTLRLECTACTEWPAVVGSRTFSLGPEITADLLDLGVRCRCPVDGPIEGVRTAQFWCGWESGDGTETWSCTVCSSELAALAAPKPQGEAGPECLHALGDLLFGQEAEDVVDNADIACGACRRGFHGQDAVVMGVRAVRDAAREIGARVPGGIEAEMVLVDELLAALQDAAGHATLKRALQSVERYTIRVPAEIAPGQVVETSLRRAG